MTRYSRIILVLFAAQFLLLAHPLEAQTCGTVNNPEQSSDLPISCDPALPPDHPISGSKTWSVSGSTTCSGSAFGGWSPYTSTGTAQNVTVTASGQCQCQPSIGGPNQPQDGEHYDFKVVYQTNCAFGTGGLCGCVTQEYTHHVTDASTCTSSNCCSTQTQCEMDGNRWDPATCTCLFSPLLINLQSAEIALSAASAGVVFDLSPGLPPVRVAWPTRPDLVAFVVDDVNGNGLIDNGQELLGSASPQAAGGERNGFNALALYDTNGDGVVSANDGTFSRLQLWFDRKRDGFTQPGELISLEAAGVIGLSLRAHQIERRDQWGNIIAYRAKAFVRRTESRAVYPTWLYDVFLRTEPAVSTAKAQE